MIWDSVIFDIVILFCRTVNQYKQTHFFQDFKRLASKIKKGGCKAAFLIKSHIVTFYRSCHNNTIDGSQFFQITFIQFTLNIDDIIRIVFFVSV